MFEVTNQQFSSCTYVNVFNFKGPSYLVKMIGTYKTFKLYTKAMP